MGGFLPTVSAAMAATNEGGVHAVEGALRRLFRRDDPYENLDLAATLIETAMGLVGPFFKHRRPQGLDRAIAAVNAGAARLRTMAGRGSGRAVAVHARIRAL